MYLDPDLVIEINDVIASKHDALHDCGSCRMVRTATLANVPQDENTMIDFYFYWSDGTWKKEN